MMLPYFCQKFLKKMPETHNISQGKPWFPAGFLLFFHPQSWKILGKFSSLPGTRRGHRFRRWVVWGIISDLPWICAKTAGPVQHWFAGCVCYLKLQFSIISTFTLRSTSLHSVSMYVYIYIYIYMCIIHMIKYDNMYAHILIYILIMTMIKTEIITILMIVISSSSYIYIYLQ